MIAKRQSIQIILSEEEKDILEKAHNVLLEFQYNSTVEEQNAVDRQIEHSYGYEDGVDTAIDVLNYLISHSVKN